MIVYNQNMKGVAFSLPDETQLSDKYVVIIGI